MEGACDRAHRMGMACAILLLVVGVVPDPDESILSREGLKGGFETRPYGVPRGSRFLAGVESLDPARVKLREQEE